MSPLSLQKHGLVIIPDGTPNGDVNHEPQSSGITVVSQEAAQLLESAGEGPLGETEIILLYQTCHIHSGCRKMMCKLLIFVTFSLLRQVNCAFLVSCRCQATEVGRRERRTVGSDQEAEESAGGGETETLKDRQFIHRWREDGEWYRPTLY